MIKYIGSCLLIMLITLSGLAQGNTATSKKDIKIKSYFDGKLFMDTATVTWIMPLNNIIHPPKKVSKNKTKKKAHKLINDTTYDKVYSDSSSVTWLSSLLYHANEPRLPLETPQKYYRFTWIRSLNEPILITLCKKDQQVLMTTKWLQRPYRDTAINLPLNKLSEFEALLNSTNFWKMKPAKATFIGNDGSTWLIEGQQGKFYHFVYRELEPRDLLKIGEWLIKNSGANREVIY